MSTLPLARIKPSDLTDKQQQFAQRVAEGANRTDAAKLAGYNHPEVEGCRLMSHPAVKQLIHQHRETIFQSEIATLSTNKLRELLTNPDVPHHVQFQAAKLGLAIAGHVEKTQRNMGLPVADKPMSEMSESELSEYIKRSENAIQVIEAELITDNKRVTKDTNVPQA